MTFNIPSFTIPMVKTGKLIVAYYDDVRQTADLALVLVSRALLIDSKPPVPVDTGRRDTSIGRAALNLSYQIRRRHGPLGPGDSLGESKLGTGFVMIFVLGQNKHIQMGNQVGDSLRH
jgi:hypothetical protein